MSCCGSKPKPISTQSKPTEPSKAKVFSLLPPNQTQGLNASYVGIATSTNQTPTTSVLKAGGEYTSAPKSTISFSAHDYDSTPLNKQAAYVSTRKITHLVIDRDDRPEDYTQQINKANQSKLLQPIQMLNFDLDKEDGVSKVPVINTFHYESVLNHCFLRNYNNAQLSQPYNNSSYSAYAHHLNSSGIDLNQSNSQLA